MTDRQEMVAFYDLLQQSWPSPVVAHNRAVAIGFARGPATGLIALDVLTGEPQLTGYGYLPAARADFLSRLGPVIEAEAAYREALSVPGNGAERAFLIDRLADLGETGPGSRDAG